MTIDGNAGSLTENLIDLIEAAGGSRPESKGLSELYQALAIALSDFTPTAGVAQVHAGTNVTVTGTLSDPIVNSSGGGGSFPDFTGDNPPEGVQTANYGQWYLNTGGGTDPLAAALYQFQGTDGTKTGWGLVAGTDDGGGGNGYQMQLNSVADGGGWQLTVEAGTGTPDADASGISLENNGSGGLTINNNSPSSNLTLKGAGGIDIEAATNGTSINSDFLYSDNTVGPVITDQSNGHTYRIICTAGVLSTQEVT
jgi:hypothetical protein